jgi:hypothetical protein
VCAKYRPCPSANTGTYSISGLGTECTDNQSCEPIPCYCYSTTNLAQGAISVSYIDCATKTEVTVSLPGGNTIYLCAQEDSVVGGQVSPAGSPCSISDQCQPI